MPRAAVVVNWDWAWVTPVGVAGLGVVIFLLAFVLPLYYMLSEYKDIHGDDDEDDKGESNDGGDAGDGDISANPAPDHGKPAALGAPTADPAGR